MATTKSTEATPLATRGTSDSWDPATISKLNRRIPLLLGVAYGLCMVDRSNVATAEQQMGAELQLTQSQFGLASGALLGAMAVGQLPLSPLIVSVGTRRALSVMMFVWGALASCCSAVQGFTSLLLLRLALGLAESGFYFTALHHMLHWFPSEVRPGSAATLGTRPKPDSLKPSLCSRSAALRGRCRRLHRHRRGRANGGQPRLHSHHARPRRRPRARRLALDAAARGCTHAAPCAVRLPAPRGPRGGGGRLAHAGRGRQGARRPALSRVSRRTPRARVWRCESFGLGDPESCAAHSTRRWP